MNIQLKQKKIMCQDKILCNFFFFYVYSSKILHVNLVRDEYKNSNFVSHKRSIHSE